MLNCTDLACVLHHHHFYAHLHHLKHHLQDDVEDSSGNRYNKPIDDTDSIYSNSTDSELSSLSHLDAPPNDIIFIIGGVLIAMIVSGIIIVSVAAAINKLRKREETSPENLNALSTVEAQQKHFGHHNHSLNSTANQQRFTNITVDNCNRINEKCLNEGQVAFTTASNNASVDTEWVFPPKAPTPTLYYYSNNFENPAAANNEIKSFKKQFSGRFKRLMIYKKQENAVAIPPELKPQLKSIYVY